MPPRRKLLPVSSGAHYLAIRIDWPQAETALGQPIPRTVKRQISLVTRDAVANSALERNTPPLSPAIARVRKLRAAAAKLRAAAATIYAIYEESVSDERRAPHHHIRADKLRALALDSRGMMRDCDAELRAQVEVEAGDSGFRVGEAWSWWIHHLTTILKAAGLPTGARNDALGDSSFVSFVAELQKSLPDEYTQHTHSLEALAKAIERARKYVSGRINVARAINKSRAAPA
jgi:hypothetical protein